MSSSAISSVGLSLPSWARNAAMPAARSESDALAGFQRSGSGATRAGETRTSGRRVGPSAPQGANMGSGVPTLATGPAVEISCKPMSE